MSGSINVIEFGNFIRFFLNRLLNRSVDLMHRIEEETGFDPGFINNGGIFIAHDEVRLLCYFNN